MHLRYRGREGVKAFLYLGSVGFPGCWHPKGIGRDAGILGMPVFGVSSHLCAPAEIAVFPESCGEDENRWAPEAGRRLPASSHDVAPEEEAIFGGYVLGIVAQGARPLTRPASERARTSQARRTMFYKRGIRDCHCNGPCCRTRDVEGNSRMWRVDWAGTSRSWFQDPWPLNWLNGRSATWCAGFRPDPAGS